MLAPSPVAAMRYNGRAGGIRTGCEPGFDAAILLWGGSIDLDINSSVQQYTYERCNITLVVVVDANVHTLEEAFQR